MEEKDLLQALAAPFEPKDIEWRVQSATRGRNGEIRLLVLPYLESRAVMKRLDEVCGCSWQTHYQLIEVNKKQAFQCQLSIKIGSEWINRTDGAEVSDIESVKGGHSNALKRSAVQWGIGRYLYELPSYWVDLKQQGEHRVYGEFKIDGTKQRISGYFDTPTLPDWALPKGYQSRKFSKTGRAQSSVQQSANAQRPSQQKPSNQSPSKAENGEREQALRYVKHLLASLGIPLNFIPELLRRTSGTEGPLEQVSIRALRELYKVLQPVYAYVEEGKKMGLSLEELLDYAKIVLKVDLKSIYSLLFKMNKAAAQECLSLARGDRKLVS